ncbi:ion transport peptide isoform X1 [Drosophila virilis]|uniref:ion transport peptide-like isoform X1 n=2 Tax=Drosophila virilis TaxID=7244 RepID=UPI00139600D3|nr:ion transport peptide-like isoform X1 [Drosophila virilis]XP_032291589.1 ion transport peptide isoform X1 [Drosophila virilis]
MRVMQLERHSDGDGDVSAAGSHRKTHQKQQAAAKMCSRNIKISVVLFLVLIPIFTALPHNHNLSKRSNFFDLECKGIFNKTMFFRLDRICEDCYQLFRETSIHRLCKANCFAHQTFGECLKVLLIDDEEIVQLQHYLKVINGSPYPFHKPVVYKY